ncbi:hypothetical protein TSOC_004536 [Tetrabaena socialis]|uniref:UGP3-like C-terminal hexapeptide repeats domain-containing protein n=1 Tax=Tetrabaena socialis TaxID=47790 RepID=A0A2J8A8N0_9CHLO|nr:hypothetical protein TSOC_004536 [Tetrabaena socialis]|eukprot:PNH08896.1 hypothetical protein TSOC_004536 [Tetrabaena socialis]
MSSRTLAPALGGPATQRPCRGALAPLPPPLPLQQRQPQRNAAAAAPRGRVRLAAALQPPREQQPQGLQAAEQPAFRLPYGSADDRAAAEPASGTVTSYDDEYLAQPGGEVPLEAQVERLQALLGRLREAGNVEAKVETLLRVDSVAAFLAHPRNAAVCEALRGMGAEEQLLLLSLPAMLQEHVLMEPWLLSRPLGPMMKPGGHGAIWKLMWDEGVFDWLTRTHGRRAALVRQISNPMAGTDTTLLALAGAGFSRGGAGGDAFGFMSCERAVGAAEGMNVLQERRRWVEGPAPAGGGGGEPGPEGAAAGRWVYEYGVTNVEYTEFERLGLSDEAVSANSKTSVFPANTNVLYVGLRAAKRIVAEAVANGNGEQLMPGLIFNLNKKVAYTDPLGGETRQLRAGRMESTMQNLADFMTDRFEQPLDPKSHASTNATLAISSLRNGTTEMPMPPPPPAPAVADAAAARAAAAGQFGSSGPAGGMLRYSSRCGRVQMVNVRVRNAGIDWQAPGNVYWKHQVARHESCKVLLLGQSEFEAHDVTIAGSHTFVVPDGHRLSVTAAADGSPRAVLTPLAPAAGQELGELGGGGGDDLSAARRLGFQPSWEWQYAMDSFGAIRLSYESSGSAVPAAGIVATVLAAAEQRSQYVLDFNI